MRWSACRRGWRIAVALWMGTLWLGTVGCDPLDQHPKKPATTVALVEPAGDTSLIQPGPRVKFVVEFDNCKDLRLVELRSDTKVVASATELRHAEGPVVFDVDLNTLLKAPDWVYDFDVGAPKSLRLWARVLCEDFGQDVSSKAVSLNISPWTSLRVGPPSARAVHSVQQGTALLVEAEGHFELWSAGEDGLGLGRLERVSVDERGAGTLLPGGDAIYFWKRCLPCHRDTSGTLYAVQLDPTLLLLDRIQLECAPVALLSAPTLDMLVVAQQRCHSTRAVTTLSSDPLAPLASAGETGGGFLTKLVTRPDGEVVGLAHDGSTPARARVFAYTSANPAWLNRDDIALDLAHSVGAIDHEGRWAAWIDTKQERLNWLPIGPPDQRGSREAPVAHSEVGPWADSVQLVVWGDERLVLSDSDRIAVYERGGESPLWQRQFSKGPLALTPATDDMLVVLTGDLNVIVLDATGRQLAEQGPLEALGDGAPGVAVANGHFHYIIRSGDESLIASYRLPAQAN